MGEHLTILEKIYSAALTETSEVELPEKLSHDISLLVSRSESNKAVITVLVTLLSHKLFDAAQDIRYHQAQLENGFAGRSIDKLEVTPFMKGVHFPAMAESGWLTRSPEQPHPYDLNYPGKIRPPEIKTAFLEIIHEVQVNGADAERCLKFLFKLLIRQRDALKIELAKPHSLSISAIINLLRQHFTYRYSSSGAARLPTLAIYASYQCMMTQVARYSGKILCPLESHNSADSQSGRIGYIDVNNENHTAFEGVEIKHEIPITRQLIADAYEKFKVYNTDRYYLLTTADMSSADWQSIEAEIQRIRRIHGCQVIVNGVYPTLSYYLRLLKNTAEFVDNYVELLKVDDAVKFQHKSIWNDIVSS